MRHAEPQAVLLSVRDAIELLVEGELAALAARPERDFEDGAVEELGPTGPVRVVLAGEAPGSCRRMVPRDRRLLREALASGLADDERLLWLSSGRWVVAFSYVEEAAALVHQAWEVRELERALVGEEIGQRRRRVTMDRALHGRAWWQLKAGGAADG